MAELVSIKRNVDVSPGQAAPAVFHCSQGDVGSKIILGLLNNGTAYAIPSGVTVTIEGSESNGSIFTPISATASGSDITFNLTGEMTAVAGPAICQAVLKSGSNILGTANFTLEVESSPMGADAPPVFTDAGWTWMLNKLNTEFVPALGNETIIDAIDSKADQSDLTALSNTVVGHTGSITVLNNTVNTLNGDVTENRQNIATKLDKNQGTANAGKYLKVGAGGNVETADLDVTTDKTLSIADKAADAKAVGDELTNLKAELSENVAINFVSKNTIIVSNLEDGFYNTVNGNKYDNVGGSTYRRSPYLVRVEEKKLYVSNIANLRACCYDKDGTLITSMYLYTKDSLKTTKPIVTPANTCFLGLFANGWPTSFSLTKYDSADTPFVEYPFQSDEYLYFEKTWTNSGTLGATDNLDCVVMPNLQAGSKYYVSNNATNCICLKWDGSTVTAEKETLYDSWGAIYTIPADTALTFWNFYRVRTKGINDESTEYISKITKRKVLAIGDSITWLEGKENFGSMPVVSGWQRQLRLAGYDVRNAGWSGHPYANGLDIVDGVDYSIYKDIVTSAYTVSGYDYIILFGGTNDVLYDGALGDRPTDYSNRTFDPSTFNGAVGGIINYIRTNNTTAKILLASFPKSEAVSRSYINASSRVDELKYNADFWSCKYVNIFDDMNVQPTYDGFDLYFYDVTHPNYNGMQLIGKLMRKAIEIYEYDSTAQSVKSAVDKLDNYATENLSGVNVVMYRYGHSALLRIDATFNQSSSYVEVGKFTNMSTFNNFYFSYVNPGNGNKAKLKYTSDGTLSIMCPDGNTAIDASFPLLLL